ncbi:MAG: PAS domain S-box protein [bacterium]|nr:PAS domain S-box protein [bacterium]
MDRRDQHPAPGAPPALPASGEDRYRTLFEDAIDGLLVADIATQRLLLGNRRMCDMLGCTEAELAGLSIADIHPAESLPRLLQEFERQVRGERHVALSVPVLCRDGTVFHADVNARSTVIDGRPCVLGIFRDASVRLEAERALRLSESKLRQSQRLGGFGHYELDVATAVWTSSEALDDLFGIDDAFDRSVANWSLLIHPDDRDGMVEYFAQEVIGKRRAFDREYRIVRPRDGAVRWVHGLGELEVDPAGVATRMFGVIQDITERRLAEEERQRFEAGVQQSQKLESLGLLAGGIAHDFNNLLFCIAGNADLAQAELPADSPARECLGVIGQASRRAADLCRQLLDYAGKGRVAKQRLNLHELIGDTDRMLSLGVPKSIELRRRFAPDLPEVEAEATQLRQVLMNLVMNAAEAIGPGIGSITLATGTMECDRAVLDRGRAESAAPAGTYVYCEVADSGGGMDVATVARMFEPFFTTKFAGRGLGLAAVLGIVRGHGGGILVDSSPGRGTRVRVLLPAARASAATGAVSPDPATGWRGHGTVLVVDDEEPVRHVARRYLERLGFRVETAGDGEEALARLGNRDAGPIDCVLLDLTMPRLDGAETLRRMREGGLDIPVVLASGFDEHDLARRFAGCGVAGYVQKPYLQVDLAERLRTVLAPGLHS